MISRYPDGVTGAALLLLRLACALLAWPVLARLWPIPAGLWLGLSSTLMILAFLSGLGTRTAAALLLALSAACLVAARGEAALFLLSAAACAGALLLLGPGAWSIDALRFGRRVIRLDPRSPDRGGHA